MSFEDFISTVDIHEAYAFKETLGEQSSIYQEEHLLKLKKLSTLNNQSQLQLNVSISTDKDIGRKRIGEEDLTMYKNQCEVMLQLEHPNIVEVYEVYDNEDYFYIVMEYMEGGELCDKKNLHKCKKQEQICKIMQTLTDALDYCHENGIVHRDIKPENILWSSSNDQTGILKIADFGFAKISRDSLMTTACGTPMFFSPEIISGQPYDSSVDFWSLGVIIFYLRLTGKSPFQGESQDQMFQNIKNVQINFSGSVWKYASTSAKDLVLRLLEKNPKKRYRASDIRRHPWILSDHKEGVQYRDRDSNLESLDDNRKIEKIRTIINLTLNDIRGESIMEQSNQSGP